MRFNGILSAAIAAGIALATVACQKIEEQSPNVEPAPTQTLTVTATIADIDGTKVSYGFTGKDKDGKTLEEKDKAKSCIKQTWEVGDQIFGFDSEGHTFTGTIPENGVDGNGKATFNVTSDETLNGKLLYAVYYPGKTAFDANNELAVDLTENNGVLNGTTKAPVIMCATAEIKDDAVSFKFYNQTAVVGIYKMQLFDEGKPVDANTSISSVTLNGVYTTGTIKKDDKGSFGLVPDGAPTGSITANGTLTTGTGENGSIIDANTTGEIKPYFSVIPGEYDKITVTASNGSKTYSTTGEITGKIEPSTYRYIGKKMGTSTVASINGVKYFTISDAFANVKSGETIKLEESCTVDKESLVSSKSDTKTVTLDLNGKTLTQDGTKRIGVAEGGDLTITDDNKEGKTGTITQTTTSIENPTFLLSAGTLTIKKGLITKATDDESTKNTNTISVNGGTLNVDGGTISNDTKATIYISSDSEKGTSGTAVISGGKVTSGTDTKDGSNAIAITGGAVEVTGGEISTKKSAAIFIDGTDEYSLSISGGEIKAPENNTIYSQSTYAESTVTVTGGKFMSKYTDEKKLAIFSYKTGTTTNYVVTGGIYNRDVNTTCLPTEPVKYVCCANRTSEAYDHKVAPVVALQVDGNESIDPFNTVEDAVSKANGDYSSNACTITINDNLNVNTTTEVTNGNGVTLDLNDNTLTFKTTNRIRPTTNGKIIIKDSGTNGTITNTSNTNVFYYTGGELVLQGGTIKPFGTSTGVVYVENAQFTMKGGTVTDDDKNVPALHINGGTAEITGGTISGGNYSNAAYGAIVIRNKAASTCTINGTSVTVSAPNVTDDKPVVSVSDGGTFNLYQGTIGGSNTNDFTAVSISKGNFYMTGGAVTSPKVALNVTDDADCNITGGTITSTGEEACAIMVNHADAEVTVGSTETTEATGAIITAPGHVYDKNNVITGTRSIVTVDAGSFTLNKGTIGNSSSSGDNGNMTAVKVTNGKFTMTGGYIYARHHALVFQGTSTTDDTSTISGGHLATINSGWSLIRFEDNSTNKLTINNGGFSLQGNTAAIFAGKKTATKIPTTATVTITNGFFSISPNKNWEDGKWDQVISGHTLSGPDSYQYDGKNYSYKVE